MIFSFTNMRGEIASDCVNLCGQQPAESVDHVRANRAERAAALRLVRPPVPRTIKIGSRIGAKNNRRVFDLANLAALKQFAHLQAAGQEAQLVID